MNKAKKEGRLVWNHSTHIEGLITVLDRLRQRPGVHTITPGVIGPVKSHAPKLQLKVSVPIRGGFKLIARQGKTVQEVFVVTELDQAGLEAAVAESLAD